MFARRRTATALTIAALAIGIITTGCSSTSSPDNTSSIMVSTPANAAIEPMTDTTDGGPCTDNVPDARTIAPRLQYTINDVHWEKNDGDNALPRLQLAINGLITNLPAGYALYGYLQQNGKCWTTSFGNSSNQIADNPSSKSFGFGLLTTLPERYAGYTVSKRDDCPGYYTFAPDGTCTHLITGGYTVVVLAVRKSEKTVLDSRSSVSATSGNRLVTKPLPDSYLVVPTRVVTSDAW